VRLCGFAVWIQAFGTYRRIQVLPAQSSNGWHNQPARKQVNESILPVASSTSSRSTSAKSFSD
jgi:hypothetical protein